MDRYKGIYAIREGPWKLILGQGGGGYRADMKPFDPDKPLVQLYNLVSDPGETTNLSNKYPELVAQLRWKIKDTQDSGGEKYK